MAYTGFGPENLSFKPGESKDFSISCSASTSHQQAVGAGLDQSLLDAGMTVSPNEVSGQPQAKTWPINDGGTQVWTLTAPNPGPSNQVQGNISGSYNSGGVAVGGLDCQIIIEPPEC